MKQVKRLVPTHFTTNETGEWKRYEGSGFTVEDIVKATTGRPDFSKDGAAINDSISLTVTKNNGMTYMVHALAFDDPAMGSGNFPRWDAYNGWTTELKNND